MESDFHSALLLSTDAILHYCDGWTGKQYGKHLSRPDSPGRRSAMGYTGIAMVVYLASQKRKRGRGRPAKIPSVFAVRLGKGWSKGKQKYEDEGKREFIARIDAIKAGRRMTDKAAIEQDMREWYKSAYPNGRPPKIMGVDRWVSRRLGTFQIVLSRARAAQRRLKGDGVK